MWIWKYIFHLHSYSWKMQRNHSPLKLYITQNTLWHFTTSITQCFFSEKLYLWKKKAKRIFSNLSKILQRGIFSCWLYISSLHISFFFSLFMYESLLFPSFSYFFWGNRYCLCFLDFLFPNFVSFSCKSDSFLNFSLFSLSFRFFCSSVFAVL